MAINKRINIKINQTGAKKATAENKTLAAGIGKTMAAYAAMAVGISKVMGILKESARLHGIQEQAEKKLATALGRTSGALLRNASALQQNSLYGDEMIIGVQASIAAFVKSEDQIKKATQATLDMATAMGMDLKGAGDLIAKTLGSTTNALTRYGVEVTGAVGSTERLESLTRGIADLWGGQAAAATMTQAGAVKQLANAYGDAKESLWGFITGMYQLDVKAISVAGALRNNANGFKDVAEEVEILTEKQKRLRDEMFSASSTEEQDSLHRRLGIIQKRLAQLSAEEEGRANKISDFQQGYDDYVKGIEAEAAAIKLAAQYYQIYNAALLARPAVAPAQDQTQLLTKQKDLTAETSYITGKLSTQGSDVTSHYQDQVGLMSNLQSGANTMFQILQTGNDKQRSQTKQYALMAAYVNTAAAITRTFLENGGWPKGILPAAAMAAAGAAQISAIQARETGGPVTSNQPYVVGEAGPELMVPEQSGMIIPNGGFSGMTINFNGNITDRRFVQSFIIPEIKKAVRMGRA